MRVQTIRTPPNLLFLFAEWINFSILLKKWRLWCHLKTTKSTDLHQAVKETLARFSLSLLNISGVATDGAPAMVGKREGLVTLIADFAKVVGNASIMKYHCIIHQENLCAKSLNIEQVISVVVKTMNFIRSRRLNHHQFQTFLNNLQSEFGDVM